MPGQQALGARRGRDVFASLPSPQGLAVDPAEPGQLRAELHPAGLGDHPSTQMRYAAKSAHRIIGMRPHALRPVPAPVRAFRFPLHSRNFFPHPMQDMKAPERVRPITIRTPLPRPQAPDQPFVQVVQDHGHGQSESRLDGIDLFLGLRVFGRSSSIFRGLVAVVVGLCPDDQLGGIVPGTG